MLLRRPSQHIPAFCFDVNDRFFAQAGLVWFYAAKDVPFLVSVCVFFSWLLGFIGTLLLPADIVLTLLNGSHRWAALLGTVIVCGMPGFIYVSCCSKVLLNVCSC